VEVFMRPLLVLALVLTLPASAFSQAAFVTEGSAAQLGGSSTILDGLVRAQDPRLTLEHYYRVKSVGSPAISPGGAWVTYTVSSPVEETNDDITEFWLVSTSGSDEPTRLEHEGRSVTNVRWSPDGRVRYVAHDSTRWSVAPDALSSPQPDNTDDPQGRPSPDGRWYAMTQEMPASVTEPPALSVFEQRHEDRFRGHAFDWYPFVRDGEDFPLSDARKTPPSEIFIEGPGGSSARQLTELGLRPSQPTWSQDGRTLLFTADEAVLDELAYGRSDIFLVTLEGELTRLTDDGYQYGSVSFSPDGRWISYVRSFGTDMIIERRLDHGGPRDIYVRPAQGGQPINLTVDWDLDPGSPMWSPDSRHLYFTGGIGGATHLFRVPSSGGEVEQVTHGERRINSLDIDPSFHRMTYLVGEFDRPSEVFVADIDGSNERQLTRVHDEFLSAVTVSSQPSESFRYRSYDGTPVEGFLQYPTGYDPNGGPYPLIVVNHGGPHSASGYGFNFKNQLFTANGYFVFLPNFRSSTGYGDAFKWATWGAWGTKDGEDVLAGVDYLIENFPVDRDRVGTTGHSYGGILTNWLITRYPDRFRAAVSGAGASNWTSNYAHSDVARTKETEFFGVPWDPEAREIMIRQSAYLNSGGVQAATLFVHGEVDYRVPLEGAIQLYTSLKKQRIPTKLIIYEGQAHGIRGHWNNVHRMMHELGWWETYLKAPMRADESN
jgi:dipeptidyl aminopeptidase/acylaminoacyl peptidase